MGDLTDEQKKVLFESATEPPFSGKFVNHKDQGDYTCANCDAVLFKSDTKFDSGSGWPSFDTAEEGSIKEVEDNTLGMKRTEVRCANCDGHLGHMFNDGPKETTGMRYCINSLALGFDEKTDK